MSSIWEKIDNAIDQEVGEFNRTTVSVRIDQVVATPAACTGVMEGDPVGTIGKVRLSNGQLVTAYVGNRSVSDGDSVLVQGGRIQ